MLHRPIESAGMIGHMDDANTLPDADVVNRIILPQDFEQMVGVRMRPESG